MAIDEQKPLIKDFILITLFAIIFSFVVSDGLRLVVKKLLQIPKEQMGIVLWGDTFFLRIIASFISTTAGAFVIGTFLKSKARLAAVLSTLPIVACWSWSLIYTTIPAYQLNIGNSKYFLLPIIIIVISPALGYFGALQGQEYLNEFQRPGSILNIRWPHWFWIFPFYLNKIVAIPVFTLLLLWRIDANSKIDDNPIFSIIFDFGNTISRIIVFLILMSFLVSMGYVYELLTAEKIKWKDGLIILGHVLLLSAVGLIFYR